MADKTTKLTFAAKTTGTKEVEELGRTIGELGKIDTFRKLNADAKESLKTWKLAEAEVKRLATEMKKAEKPTAAMRREFEKSKKAAAKLKGEYEHTRKRINGLRESMKKSGIDTKNLVTEQKRLQTALAATRREAGKSMKIDAARGLLAVRPHKDIQREIKKTRLAYERLRKSGKLTSAELSQAHRRMRSRIRELNVETGRWGRSVGAVRSGLLSLAVGGYAALRGLSATTAVLKDAEQAAFNMEKSVAAANREFADTGNVEQWEDAVRRLSDELRIYSDSSIRNAISRTVDMTKRLGLSTDQMEEVIRRSADLGAGKVELTGAIERVTAALRGEAESAEYLGLTLNENYIKAWYEASGATQGVWKDLNDLQKAQIRYAVFLEQSAEMQGRAADSAETYGGALAIVKKEIENAIVNNPEVIASMNALGKVLRDNAKEIGALVGGLVKLVAGLVKFAAENQGVVKGLAGGLVVLLAWKAGIGDIVTGTIGMAGNMRTASLSTGLMTGALGKLAIAGRALIMLGPALVGVFSTIMVGKAIKGYLEMRDAQNHAAESQENLYRITDKVKKKFEEFADTEILGNLWEKPLTDLEKYKSELAKARAYFVAVTTELQQKAQEKTFFGKQTEAAKQAQAELDRLAPRYNEIAAAANEVNKVLQERQRITEETIADFEAPGALKVPIEVDKESVDQSVAAVEDKIDTLPDKKTVAIEARVEGLDLVESLIRKIARLKDKTIVLTTVHRSVEAKAAGGIVGAFARMGGMISRGSGNKDDVPAMLTRGEFVLPKAAVEKYGAGLMESLRNLSLPVPAYEMGGMVAGQTSPGLGNLGTLNLSLGGTTVQTFARPDVVGQIEAAIRRESRMRRNY